MMNAQERAVPTTRRSRPDHAEARVSLVIPTMNEAKNLPFVLPLVPDWVFEVILVDGRSTDDTVEVARGLMPDIRVVHQVGRGKGSALREGFAAARGEIIVMIDADGSMDPREMGMFVRHLRLGADFVKGSRFAQGGGSTDITVLRNLGNLGLTLLVRVLFRCAFTDLCYGYSAFWKDVLPILELDADGFEIETMMNVRAVRAGLRVVEVISHEDERIHGSSNLSTFKDGWRVLKTIMRETRRPQSRAAQRATRPSLRELGATQSVGGAVLER